MTDRAATHDTLKLTLAILDRLDEVTPTSAPELHLQMSPKFGRDLRTYQRLLKMLAEEGLAEVQGDERPLSYRRKRRGAALVQPLTAEEGLFLQLAQGQLAPLLPRAMAERLQGLLNRAHMALMPPPLPGSAASDRSSKRVDPQRERRWLRKVGVAPLGLTLLPPEIDAEVSATVAEALYQDEFLDIDYLPASGRRKDGSRVAPLALMQQGPSLYLIVRYEGHDEERQLALHRIQRARRTGIALPQDAPPFDLAAYITSGRAGFGSGAQVDVVFDIEEDSGKHLRETPLSRNQTIEPLEEGWLRVSATVADSLWFWDWLRGFGHRAELVEPAARVDNLWDCGLP